MLYYVSDIFLFIEKFRVLDKTVSCNHLQGQSRKWNASVSRGKEETDLPISKQYIIPGSPIPYTLIRSRRKTISIRILPSGEVEVRAPMRASRRAVEEFIYEKSEWIHLHVQRNQELYRQKKKSLETFPRQIPFLGAQLPVLEGEVSFSRGVFYLPRKPLGELLSLLQEVYKEQAAAYFPGRTEYWAEKTELYPEGISVGSAKGSWGSCTGKNTIRFSCWLMAAPPEAIDAVIVHELCHIKEHNHSKKFWRLVETFIPDYSLQRQLLKDTLRNLEAAGLR